MKRSAIVTRLFTGSLAPVLVTLSACGAEKKYTCTIYGEIGGRRIFLKQVTVSSREECYRLATS